MKYIITYEDALRISDAYKNFNFYKTEHMFGNYKVVTFNYFLCDYRNFVMPLREDPSINALDMRGVTFVFNEDGTLYNRFLMLPKFFNVNQVEDTQLSLLRNKKIKKVTIKEDGSLIAFMNLPNGGVFAKTQAGFTNEQSVAAMKIYETNDNIRIFVNWALRKSFTPLFEYVAYDNRIVIKYLGKELRLIGLRHNVTGGYVSAADGNEKYHISCVDSINIKSLDELEEMMKTSTDIEGVVVEFEDRQLVKWKTDWYFNLHGIRTMNIFREDFVIENYLKETLDDATQELNMTDDADAFRFIEMVKTAVKNWSDYIDTNVDDIVNSYKDYDSWDDFAKANNKKAFFMMAKNKINDSSTYNKRKIEYMLTKTYHLMDAKNIVEKFKN